MVLFERVEDYTNEQRAAAAREALKGEKYGAQDVELPTSIPDLIADLLHLAASVGLDPEEMLDTANLNYQVKTFPESEATP